MTARFAGSRNLDERRRRRLATESEEPIDKTGSQFDDPDLSDSEMDNQESESELLNSFADPSLLPLRRLISRRHWKLSTVVLGAFAIGVGLIQLGLMAENRVLPLEWAAFSPGFNSFVRFYVAALLVVSAQMSLLIAWVRSESPHDFAGRYRTWHWVAGVFGVASVWAATDLHLIIANAVAIHFPPAILNAPQLYWLLPLSVVGFMLLAFLNREVATSSLSCACLWGATLSFCAAAMIWCGLTGDLGWLALTSTVMFGAFAVFSGVLFHARHVIYVSADSPARSEAPLRRVARRVVVGTKLSRRRRLQRRLEARAAREERRELRAKVKSETARLRQEAKEQAKADAEAARKEKAERRRKVATPTDDVGTQDDADSQSVDTDESDNSETPKPKATPPSKTRSGRTAKTAEDLAEEAEQANPGERRDDAATDREADLNSADSASEADDMSSNEEPAKQSRRQRKKSKRGKRAA